MDLKLSSGPGEGIVNPVKGVGGVEDRLVSGDNDMVRFGSANKGPPSCKVDIRDVSRSWLNQSTQDDATR
jgi:hypothetical protein